MPALTTRPAHAVHTARRFLNSLVAAVVLIAAAMPFAAPALAHDAKPTAAMPQGWSYPFSCCSGYDCREVAPISIGERPEGYVIKGTGEVVAYSDKRIKNSPDGAYHWCSVAGANDGKTICLFVPPSSY
ncbi:MULTISPECIES: hypothetical protein [unclassified Mesorhizobium]|uniref:hypothetical protein n=1 Tax=unclassified Mesorhizobium TaxID=325217 RepID=UPI0003CE3649|nr:hypothetical protein [Mesorhizobium sp. LSHC420B00]ESX82134.1 hypothetical protein X759_05470 [Mesorhizobium sp. LSHC420B00]